MDTDTGRSTPKASASTAALRLANFLTDKWKWKENQDYVILGRIKFYHTLLSLYVSAVLLICLFFACDPCRNRNLCRESGVITFHSVCLRIPCSSCCKFAILGSGLASKRFFLSAAAALRSCISACSWSDSTSHGRRFQVSNSHNSQMNKKCLQHV